MSIKAIPPVSKEQPVSAVAEKAPVTENVAAFDSSKTPLTTEALLTLIAGMQQQLLESQKQTAEANKALAAAIIESGKPKEPVKTAKQIAEEKNAEMFDKQQRELFQRRKAGIKAEQDSCDHIAGGSPLSEQRDIAGRTSILWHRNDVGVDEGICTVCQRIFLPSDPPDTNGTTYAAWRKKPSFNKLSSAGFRTILDPVRARKESYLHDIE